MGQWVLMTMGNDDNADNEDIARAMMTLLEQWRQWAMMTLLGQWGYCQCNEENEQWGQ